MLVGAIRQRLSSLLTFTGPYFGKASRTSATFAVSTNAGGAVNSSSIAQRLVLRSRFELRALAAHRGRAPQRVLALRQRSRRRPPPAAASRSSGKAIRRRYRHDEGDAIVRQQA